MIFFSSLFINWAPEISFLGKNDLDGDLFGVKEMVLYPVTQSLKVGALTLIALHVSPYNTMHYPFSS